MSKLILNIDSTHFFFTRKAEEVTPETVDAFVDQYAGTQVSEIAFCVNCMRTSFDSRVFESIWKDYDPALGTDQTCLSAIGEPQEKRQFENLMKLGRKLQDGGIDVYRRWIARCRETGISPWISTRMNDIHSVDNERFPLHSDFWKAHPEMRRTPYHFTSWPDKALDFGQKAVRNRHLKLIRELAERYDMDGLELDWMRFGYHFRPGFEEEGAKLLTEFVAEVRALLDRQAKSRSHRIALSARVPSRPETALALGMDAAAWAKKGYLDALTVTPFFETSENDISLEIWKRLLDGTGVRLAAGLELLLRAFPQSDLRQTNSLETARGAAMSYLTRGADDVYLFNYFDRQTCMDDLENYPRLLREVGSLETLRGKPRRHVVTYTDTWGVGEARASLLPAAVRAEECRAFRVPIGEKPRGQRAFAVLGFTGACADEGRLWVNGALCRAAHPFALPRPRPAGPVVAFEIDDGILHDGMNMIEMMGFEGVVDWVEINIR